MFTQIIGFLTLIIIIYAFYRVIRYIYHVVSSSGKAIVNREDTTNIDGLFYVLNAAVIISTIISYNLIISIISLPFGKYIIGPFQKAIVAIIIFFTLRSCLKNILGYPYELAYKEEKIGEAIIGIGTILLMTFILINGLSQGGLYRIIETFIRSW